jgi:hypothetical protein
VVQAWLSGILAVACLLVGVFHLARILLVREGALGELSHATMGFGMAAMFVPAADPLPRPAWLVAFAVTGAWFAGVAVRAGTGRGEPAHHVVSAGAMTFMLLAHAPTAAAVHAHRGVVAADGGSATLLLTGLALLLAAYFVAHAVRHLTGSAQHVPAVTPDRVAVLSRVRARHVDPAVHVVTGAVMAVMLLGVA